MRSYGTTPGIGAAGLAAVLPACGGSESSSAEPGTFAQFTLSERRLADLKLPLL